MTILLLIWTFLILFELVWACLNFSDLVWSFLWNSYQPQLMLLNWGGLWQSRQRDKSHLGKNYCLILSILSNLVWTFQVLFVKFWSTLIVLTRFLMLQNWGGLRESRQSNKSHLDKNSCLIFSFLVRSCLNLSYLVWEIPINPNCFDEIFNVTKLGRTWRVKAKRQVTPW